MDQNRQFSDQVYQVENGNVPVNERSQNKDYIILDKVDTNKDKIGTDKAPKKNSMQAMVVAEIKAEYKNKKTAYLKQIPGYPEAVVKNEAKITNMQMEVLKEKRSDTGGLVYMCDFQKK